jgi:hypothetical protein
MEPEPQPTNYVGVQAAALRVAVQAAVTTGDMRPVDQLVDHMVAEGPTGITKNWVLAVALFKLSMEAKHQGRPDQAAQYDQMAITECGTEAVHLVVATVLLDAGRRRGWLHAEEHDRVAEIAADEFPELLNQLAQVQRRDP